MGKKVLNLATCNNMDTPRGYNAKWNNSVRERQIAYDFTQMWKLRSKANKIKKRQTKKTDS